MTPAGPFRAYRKYVDGLPKPKLMNEWTTQRQALWAAQHGIRHDPKAEAIAQRKLAIVEREMTSRNISIPRPMPWMPRDAFVA